MAVAVKSGDLGIYVNDVQVACAQSASLTISREYLDAVCAGTGAWSEKSPGVMSWSGSIDALWRSIPTAEADTNVDARDIFDDLVAGTLVEIRFGYIDGTPTNVNGYQFSGMAYWETIDLTSPINDTQTWTASFLGNGPITRITVPTA